MKIDVMDLFFNKWKTNSKSVAIKLKQKKCQKNLLSMLLIYIWTE